MKKRCLAVTTVALILFGAKVASAAWGVDTNINYNSNNNSSRHDNVYSLDADSYKNSFNRYDNDTSNRNSFNRYDNDSYSLDSYNRDYSQTDNSMTDSHAVTDSYNSLDSHAISGSYNGNTSDMSHDNRFQSHDIAGSVDNSVLGNFTQAVGGDSTLTFGDVQVSNVGGAQ